MQVTRRGRRVAALVSAERLEALMETIEILGDRRTLEMLRRARKEIAAGRAIPLEKALADLGL